MTYDSVVIRNDHGEVIGATTCPGKMWPWSHECGNTLLQMKGLQPTRLFSFSIFVHLSCFADTYEGTEQWTCRCHLILFNPIIRIIELMHISSFVNMLRSQWHLLQSNVPDSRYIYDILHAAVAQEHIEEWCKGPFDLLFQLNVDRCHLDDLRGDLIR